MFTSQVKRRVMEVLNQKIELAQKEHDDEVKKLEAQLEIDKAASLEKSVNSIIKKFI